MHTSSSGKDQKRRQTVSIDQEEKTVASSLLKTSLTTGGMRPALSLSGRPAKYQKTSSHNMHILLLYNLDAYLVNTENYGKTQLSFVHLDID